jgi:hypothetical protein
MRKKDTELPERLRDADATDFERRLLDAARLSKMSLASRLPRKTFQVVSRWGPGGRALLSNYQRPLRSCWRYDFGFPDAAAA